MFARQRRRRTAMLRIIRVDRLYGGQDLLRRLKREEALACRECAAEARILSYHGAPRSKVLGAALAEPSAAEAHVLVLGYREFAARSADVAVIGVEVR